MGDKEEAENDRRKLMNKIFCSALTAVVAGAMLTGCAMPWEKGADDDVQNVYHNWENMPVEEEE